jgi:DNA-binding CsgD family transcriptional regulator
MHLMSQDEQALTFAKQALATATSDEQAAESLWTSFVAANDLEIPEAAILLDEYQRRAAPGTDSRLRAGVAHMLQALRNGRVDGVTAQMETLLPLAGLPGDPFVQASFISSLAYLYALRAYYTEAIRVIDVGLARSREMRLEWVQSMYLASRGYAEIGLRRFRDGRRTANALASSGSRLHDAYLRAVASILRLRADLCQLGSTSAAYRLSQTSLSYLPRHAHAELLALRALRSASHGDSDTVQRLAHEALELTGSIEAVFLARFALLIIAERPDQRPPTGAAALLADVTAAEAFDCFVIAYRSYPQLLRWGFALLGPDAPLMDAVVRANDMALAAQYAPGALPLPDDTGPLDLLTARESEVLQLIGQGLSNAEIATRLVVEVSTVKSHVHAIIKKLGVRSRLQAALHARARIDGD